MPSISIHDLRHAIPRYHGQVNEPDVSLKYPDIARLRLFASHIEVTGRNGYVQRFRIVWIPSAACQIVENRCQQKPNGSTANAIKGYVIKSRRSKPKPIKHASASRSIFVPSLITSELCTVIEFLRIEPPLGQGNQQHLITAAFGSPSEARDLPGGP